VYRLRRERDQEYGAGQLIDILLGRKTQRVIDNDHASLTVFGVGTDLSEREWRGVTRQLLAQGLLAVKGDYGVLTLTPASSEVLGQRRQVMMRREPDRPPRAAKAARAASAAATVAELPPAAMPVFEQLRAWRAATAKDQGMPAYVIFHDATLRQIAVEAPATLDALAGVSGVGEAKLARYGQQILDVLNG